jgi:polar amino acid transport system substrate-binding protein
MKTLKQRYLCVLTVFLSVIGGIASYSTQAAEDQSKQRLVVYTLPTSAPRSSLQDGKVAGFLVDITTEVVRRAGYEIDMQALPWARAVLAASSGEGLITCFSMTAERQKTFLFSEPIHEDKVLLVTRSDANFPFKNLKDLSGKRIGIMRSSAFGEEFVAALPLFTVDRDDNADQRLKKLVGGYIDGAIVSGGIPSTLLHLKAIGMDRKSVVIHDSTPIAIDKNYIGIAKTYPNASEILSKLNRAIASMRADGTIAKIMANYE